MVKTTIFEDDYPKILASYNLGEYLGYKTFANGAGQTTLLLITTLGKYVLRYYENRPKEHVLFEIELFNFLLHNNFPVPKIIPTKQDQFLGEYKHKPLIIIEFIEGEHGNDPNKELNFSQLSKVIETVAKLHLTTQNYQPVNNRPGFDIQYCLNQFRQNFPHLVNTSEGNDFENCLKEIQLLSDLPKGICHADLNYGNFLFKDGRIVAILDFDMSFITYFVYDIANLIYWWAWPPGENLKFDEAWKIIEEYSKYRKLSSEERKSIKDALKLIILLGISWDSESEFTKEMEKIELLNNLDFTN